MKNLVTVTLEIRSGEDPEWAKGKIVQALREHDQDALDTVVQFVTDWNPQVPHEQVLPEWTPVHIAQYAMCINAQDESGDATMVAFSQEEPTALDLPFTDFCRAFLNWAQGPNWEISGAAVDWFRYGQP
jgi:hypothetical protein